MDTFLLKFTSLHVESDCSLGWNWVVGRRKYAEGLFCRQLGVNRNISPLLKIEILKKSSDFAVGYNIIDLKGVL